MTTVLLVDDNDVQRKLSRICLEEAGYSVQDTSNATDALRVARTYQPDVIVSDVMMDCIDGFGLCRRLAPIPVVLVSAHYDDHSARELAISLGASALIRRTPDFSAEMAGIYACVHTTTHEVPRKQHESYEAHLETNAKQLNKLLESTRRAELRWRTLFDHAHDTFTLITPEGVIVEANHQWEVVLGVPPSQIIGKHFSAFSAPALVESHVATFEAMLAKRITNARVTLRHVNGSTVYMDFATSMFELEGTDHLLAIGRDVTEKVEAEQRIERAEAAKRKLEEHIAHTQRLEMVGQMTGSIAHDFNNILSAIFLNAECLIDDLSEGDPRRSDAEEIRASARRAAALTKHLLAFSRNQVLELADLDVSNVVTSLGRMLSRVTGPEIDLQLEDSSDHARVCADLVQLEQVVVNLAVNARDAMGGRGVLRIHTCIVDTTEGSDVPVGRFVRISVTDTGCGMSEETQRRIFEPFFTTKERGHGTGLGLSTSFGIVKQLGGEIVVESELGRGTTMHVYLPRV